MAGKAAGAAQRLNRVLGRTSWVVLVGGLSAVGVQAWQTSTTAAQTTLEYALGLFFVLLLLRLAAAAATLRGRRTALLVLLCAVALWAAGSAQLNSSPNPDLTTFPSPGEWLFLGAYVGFAAYLLIDTAQRMTNSLATWLETVVICGGTGCVAGGLLMSPAASKLGGSGSALLLALVYPIADVMLGLLVVAQVVLRARAGYRHSAFLLLAFGFWLFADVQFITNLSRHTYDFGIINIACWGLGFALLVQHACTAASVAPDAVPRRQGPKLMIATAAIATIVLTLHPRGSVAMVLQVAALTTLVAAGGRLALALRDANRATEAFALSRSDDLTLLPNRRAVVARLDSALQSGEPLGLMLLDLDGFKDVNDTLGHTVGDRVLTLIAHRIREALPTEVFLARLGGDEFATVIPHDDEIELMETAQTILAAVREPMMLDGIKITADASVGITTRSQTDSDSVELLRRADVAMYQAKTSRAGALLYDALHDGFCRERLQIAEELRTGIAEGQLTLWYQPQINAATQQLCGLEALVRWNHPKQGVMSPATFLPAARKAGLMLQLSEAVGKLAIRDMRHWHERGLDVRIALNCAPAELLSGLFIPQLIEELDLAGINGDRIVIEVTEETFIAEPERARVILQEIRAHGLQISIDDYGTGFSSLSYLRDLPVQELKIDRSFVSSVTDDQRSRMIVASTLQMAHALGLRAVAEGVENSATSAELVSMGADVLQGYHLSQPLPPTEVEAWVRNWTSYTDDGATVLPIDEHH